MMFGQPCGSSVRILTSHVLDNRFLSSNTVRQCRLTTCKHRADVAFVDLDLLKLGVVEANLLLILHDAVEQLLVLLRLCSCEGRGSDATSPFEHKNNATTRTHGAAWLGSLSCPNPPWVKHMQAASTLQAMAAIWLSVGDFSQSVCCYDGIILHL